MKRFAAITLVALIAAMPLGATAQPANPDTTRPPNSSTGQGIKNDAAEAKQSIKNTARKAKRKVAVAECNDGRFSYTHHKTCNKHGGVKNRLR